MPGEDALGARACAKQKAVTSEKATSRLAYRIDIVGDLHLLQVDGAYADALQAVQPEIVGVTGVVAGNDSQRYDRRSRFIQEVTLANRAKVQYAAISGIDESAAFQFHGAPNIESANAVGAKRKPVASGLAKSTP